MRVAKIEDGLLVREGDWVGFKYDTELCGQIKKIRNGYLDIEVTDDNTGHTSIITMFAKECWEA